MTGENIDIIKSKPVHDLIMELHQVSKLVTRIAEDLLEQDETIVVEKLWDIKRLVNREMVKLGYYDGYIQDNI